MELCQAYLKSILHYDPDTGVFVWKERPLDYFPTYRSYRSWNGRYKNTAAGMLHPEGYWIIKINYRGWKAHRLAFIYMTGSEPSCETDHVNGIRNDNRWCNLRAVSKQENLKNQKQYKNNSSGVTGVSLKKQSGKWQAYIRDGNHQIHLGYFLSKQGALDARKKAEARLGFHENHGRIL